MEKNLTSPFFAPLLLLSKRANYSTTAISFTYGQQTDRQTRENNNTLETPWLLLFRPDLESPHLKDISSKCCIALLQQPNIAYLRPSSGRKPWHYAASGFPVPSLPFRKKRKESQFREQLFSSYLRNFPSFGTHYLFHPFHHWFLLYLSVRLCAKLVE